MKTPRKIIVFYAVVWVAILISGLIVIPTTPEAGMSEVGKTALLSVVIVGFLISVLIYEITERCAPRRAKQKEVK